ncbi:MAG TPA: methionyl-tRNA formyltransferase, partial [Cellvibrionaceae bacterium]|nr:methionyl-tRNA formyltransferase [Cellvibrionaceae bacterium]
MPPAPLKIIFAGTPVFAALHLEALLGSCHEVVAVYTQPDRPAGRGKQLQASPVKSLALQHQLPVCQVSSLKTPEAQAELAHWGADIMVVVAYGLLLPQAVLDTPRLGCINVHASLLPRWRGAAPIQRAIEAGDASTGITIMQMDAGLDTGPMLAITPCPILPTDTATDLHDRLGSLGPAALLSALDDLACGRAAPQAQPSEGVTYAHKLTKEEAAIDWTLDAQLIERRVRAFNPAPVAYFHLGQERVRVLGALLENGLSGVPGEIMRLDASGLYVACGSGGLRIETLQLPGKNPVAVKALINGSHPFA